LATDTLVPDTFSEVIGPPPSPGVRNGGEAAPTVRRLGAPVLDPGASPALTVEHGFVEIVAHLTEVMAFWSQHIPPMRAWRVGAPAAAVEPVHQMRVALRRLRSALRAFGGVLPSAALDALKVDLKKLGQVLGPARDWDVFLSDTLQPVVAALPTEPLLLALRRAAERQRAKAYAALHAYLESGEFALLAAALERLTVHRPWAETGDDLLREAQRGPLVEFSAHVLRRRYRHVLARGAHMDEMPLAELHALRLQAKQLRYLAEFFAPFFPTKATGRFVRRLSRLQAALGAVNDGVVATELMRALPPATRRAQGIVQGYIAGRSGDTRQRVQDSWQRFRKQDGFW
jgi:CHAD domain-containing protein